MRYRLPQQQMADLLRAVGTLVDEVRGLRADLARNPGAAAAAEQEQERAQEQPQVGGGDGDETVTQQFMDGQEHTVHLTEPAHPGGAGSEAAAAAAGESVPVHLTEPAPAPAKKAAARKRAPAKKAAARKRTGS